MAEPELSPEIAAELAELEAALRGEPGAGDELSALVREVRAAAPELDHAAGAELDARVSGQFARSSKAGSGAGGGWLRRRSGGFAFGGAGGVLAVAVLALVGVGGSLAVLSQHSADEDATTMSAAPSDAARPAMAESAAADESLAASPSAGADGRGQVVESANGGGSSVASGSSNSSSGVAIPADSVGPLVRPTAPGSAANSASSAAPGAGGNSERAVRRSVDMTVTVDELDEAASRVGEITAGAGGFVSTSDVNLREGDTGSGSFTLRIPTAKLDATLQELGELGVVTEQNRSSQDITSQLNSAQRRLDDAKDERTALLRALAKAESAGQIAALRARIADNRREQARLDAAVQRVQRQTTTSTVQLLLTTDRLASGSSEPDRDGLRGALDDAVNVLEAIASFLVVFTAVVAPFALIAAAGSWVIRRRRRARHRRALGDD